jgi:hypothetical protein
MAKGYKRDMHTCEGALRYRSGVMHEKGNTCGSGSNGMCMGEQKE